MVFAFKFPDLGEGIHEGKIVKWLVKEGDSVKADQIIAEVETDKAVVELPSPATGTMLKLYFQQGEIVQVGKVVVAIGSPGEQVPQQEAEAEALAPAGVEHAKVVPLTLAQSHQIEGEAPKLHVTIEGERAVSVPQPYQPQVQASVPSSPASGNVLATPATRALAREMGVDLSAVRGSGPGGRVMPEDVKKHAQMPKGSAPVQQASQTSTSVASATQQMASAPAGVPADFQYPKLSFPTEGIERVPLSPLRKAIVQKMNESNRWIPQVTHFDEADITHLEAVRQSAKGPAEEVGVKLTMLPFVAKAVANALKQFPEFNSSLDYEKQELVLKKFYNLGFAVDTDEGLIVVVIKDAGSKGIMEFAQQIPALAEKARERKASLDEIRGGTFTITNIGSVGGVGATPIINFPEAAILGIFRAKDKPVVVEGKIEVRKVMPLCVSFDHRIIDGAQAARFLAFVVKQLEDPSLL